MGNSKKLIVLVVVFVLLMAGAGILYNKLIKDRNALNGGLGSGQTQSDGKENGDSEEEKEKISAPDFKIYDEDGNEYTMADFDGRPVVINFWASWCGPCKSEMPDFEEVYNKYKDDVSFVMINSTDGSRETVKSASEFISENGYTFPVYYDTEFSASSVYGATALPTTFVIDSDGFVFGYNPGVLQGDVLAAALDELLGS